MRRIGLYGFLAAATVASLFAAAVTVSSRAASPSPSNDYPQQRAHALAETRLLDESSTSLRTNWKGVASGRQVSTKRPDFMRRQFEEAGLDVSASTGAFQTFSMSTDPELGSPNSLQFLGPDGETIVLKQDVDFVPAHSAAAERSKVNWPLRVMRSIRRRITTRTSKGSMPRERSSSSCGACRGRRSAWTISTVRTETSPTMPTCEEAEQCDGRGAPAILIVNDPLTVRTISRIAKQCVRKTADRVIEAAEAFEAAEPERQRRPVAKICLQPSPD